MNIRIPLFILLGLLISANGFSQLHGGDFDGTRYGFTTLPIRPDHPVPIAGSPYFHSDFMMGTLTLADHDPLKLLMRYNVSTEQIEIKPVRNSEEIFILPADRKAEYLINGARFVADQIKAEGKQITGYFIELFNEGSNRLLKKPVLSVSEAVTATSGYGKAEPAAYKIHEEYFIILDEGKVHQVEPKHRTLKKIFEDEASKDFLKEQKVKSEEDLIAFVKFLDTQ